MQLPTLHSIYNLFFKASSRGLVVLILSTFGLFGQTSYEQFLEEEDLYERSRMAYELYHHYLRFDLDSIKVASMDLLLDDGVEDGSLPQNMGYRMLGAYMIRTGSISSGLNLLKRSADYFEQNLDYLMASEIYNDIGHGLTLDLEFDEAKVAYGSSLELGMHSVDPTSRFNALLGLGKVELLTGDTISAEEHFIEYRLSSLRMNKYEAASDATSVLANLYLEQNRRKRGLALMKEAVQMSLQSSSRIHHSHAYTNLAIFYFENHQLDSSYHYFRKAYNLRNKLQNEKAIVESLYNIGDFHRYSFDPDSAYHYYFDSYKLAEENGFLTDQIDASKGILACFSVKSFEYDEWQEISDSLEKLIQQRSGLSNDIIEYALSLSSDINDGTYDDQNLSWLQYALITALLLGGTYLIVRSTS